VNPAQVFGTRGGGAWTAERLDKLGREELAQLAANAERLGESELAERCREILKSAPKGGGGTGARTDRSGRLVPRSHAFAARGVYLKDPGRSWSGIRKADGKVVFAMWRAAVLLENGGCACLLWGPNRDGARVWSDGDAGRERLEHCKLAAGQAAAEGILVHGVALEGRLPEDRARSVLGVDPDTLISLAVVARGEEFWGVWGKKRAEAPPQAREQIRA
jgi:hypothetical protein